MIFKTGRWNYWMRSTSFVKNILVDLRCSFTSCFVEMNHSSWDDLIFIITWRCYFTTLTELMNDYDDTHASNPLQSWKFLMKMFLRWSDLPSLEAHNGHSVGNFWAESASTWGNWAILLSSGVTFWRLRSLIFWKSRTRRWKRNSIDGCDWHLIKIDNAFANLRDSAGRCWDKFAFMKTSIDYALKHPQVKNGLKQYIIEPEKN